MIPQNTPQLPALFRPHFPTMQTRETVIDLAAFGLLAPDIAVILHCTEGEVKLHYEQEMATGLMRTNARVQAVILHKIIHERDGNMAKLWMLNKGGWRTGDGARALMQVNQINGASETAPQVAVVERRAIMGRVLEQLTAARRAEDTMIDVTPPPKAPRGGSGSPPVRHR